MKLYDATGREVDLGALKSEQAPPTYAGVRNIHSVFSPSYGLDPARLTAMLRGASAGDPFQYLELAEEMEEKDLHYLAVIGVRKNAVAQLELRVEAASAAADDRRAADLIREALSSGAIDMSASVGDLLDALGKGFSVAEIIWDTEGASWMPVELKWRDPRWFLFDWIRGDELLVRGAEKHQAREASHFKGMGGFDYEMMQPMTERLAPYKFVVHVSKAKAGLPIRGGLARAAAWAYLFKNYIIKDWVTYAEVYGHPLRIGKYQTGATRAEKQNLLSIVSNLGSDAAAVIPESMAIEFAQTSQPASADIYIKMCEYLDAQVSKAVLGQTLTTEISGASGSRAAAEVHDSVRREIVSADVRRLEGTLARQLVRPIIDLNMGPQRVYPKLRFIVEDTLDRREVVETAGMLADRGASISIAALLERLGLPPAQDGELTLGRRSSAS